MEVEQFESICMATLVPGLIGYMLFIIYRLAKDSQAGRFGMFVLFSVLAFGMLGFASKYIIKAFII